MRLNKYLTPALGFFSAAAAGAALSATEQNQEPETDEERLTSRSSAQSRSY